MARWRPLDFVLAALLIVAPVVSVGAPGAPFSTANTTAAEAQAAEPSVSAELPKVVFVFDKECQIWCNKVKPIVSELKDQYKGQVSFVSLDTSSDSILASREQAKSLGLTKFLADNQKYAPVVGVFSARGKLTKELVGPKGKSIYQDAIAKVLVR